MPTFQFMQGNVFSADPLGGNPLAVVHAAEGLSEAQMAALARWTNLSETTFLLPPTDPGADYYVRIFTPVGELPFAGHPTLGSCHAWLAAGGKPRKPSLVVQQCGVGLVRVRCDGPRLEFAAPPLRRTGALEPDVLAKIAKALAWRRTRSGESTNASSGSKQRHESLSRRNSRTRNSR
jgi:PhzF family phenazine biosynthesis protein